MVKKTKGLEDLSKRKKDESSGVFQKLLLWVFIPLLFTSALVLIIAKFADVNVFDKAKEMSTNLPFIGEQKTKDSASDDIVLEERVVNLQAELKEKEAQLFKVQKELDASVDEKESLLIEQERLLDEITVLERREESTKEKFTEIVTTFEKMSAKSAAPVITNMSDAEALQILTNLKSDTLAKILEKMTPEDAAKYTTMMTK